MYSFTTNYGAYSPQRQAYTVPAPFAFKAVPAVPEVAQEYIHEPIAEAIAVEAAPAPAPVAREHYEFAPVPAVPAPAPAPAVVEEYHAAAPAPAVVEEYHAAAAPAPEVQTQVATQFHAQDEFGRVQYGYSNVNSHKQETRDEYGNVHGTYT